MDNQFKKMLVQRFGENLRFNEPMSAHTTLRVGGPADLFACPGTIDDLIFLLKSLHGANIPWFVLGAGSNLLVRDGGIRGLVISMRKFNNISESAGENNAVIVSAGAGSHLAGLCRYAAERGLAGMNFAVGIPGSVGGSILGNAGTAEGDMESVIRSVTLLWPCGRIETVEKNRLIFSYRSLVIKKEIKKEIKKPEGYGSNASPLLIQGDFSLVHAELGGESSEISASASTAMEKRMRLQPAGLSAGCFFKNPESGPSAGELIDRAGLKGFSIGAALVSEKHANFIVNTGGAMAADILAVAGHVRRTVRKLFNVTLFPEVIIVGEE
ncbi:MAG: UDP-N-acetylmuramate dehydrogenase [Deltaproteobacteria bacterium]|nr:UDP-N-acetylmuramate dehydrogenase [Deltaproteobacteria bacterium]